MTLSRTSEPHIEQDARDPDETLETVRTERDFIARRLLDGDWRWVGISSNAMTSYAMFGNAITERRFPHDWGDYARCVNTYHRAPEHLRPAMLRCLRTFREYVAAKYPENSELEWMEADPVA